MMQIAFYKGTPPTLLRKLGHWLICLWTWSKWSHAELVIDGPCYSSSKMDGGVRSKKIELDTGRWDVVDIQYDQYSKAKALGWFSKHEEDEYDDRNIVRFILPFAGHSADKWTCFEAVGAMLGLAGSQKLTANDLHKWAMENKDESKS